MQTPPQTLAKRGPSTRAVAVVFFILGSLCGFGAGVLSVKVVREFLGSMFQSERPADLRAPAMVDRPAFTFQHPSNWKVDTADSDYDADHSFSVDSPGSSMVTFQIADGEITPAGSAETMATTFAGKLMKDGKRTTFSTWGLHTGVGILLRGHHLALAAGTIRIFSFREGERTFTIVETTYDDDRASVQPGFDLIEKSFRTKAAGNAAPASSR